MIGSRTILIGLIVLAIALTGYVVERLYVTPKEAVSYAIDRSLESTTDEQFDLLDRYLHDQFFEEDPPSLLRNVLRRASSDSSGAFSRERLQKGLKTFFKRANVKRHVIMSKEISINRDRATVQLSLLTFYTNDESQKTNRIERKFLSKWTLKLTPSDDRWQITDLTYRN